MRRRNLLLIPIVLAVVAFTGHAAVSQGSAPVAAQTLARKDFAWAHRRISSANIYVLRGSAAAPLLSRLATESDNAIRDNLEWLGARRSGHRLNLFFVGARDEQRPFTGTRAGGWSVVSEGTAFLVASDSITPAIRHEVMHLLSWRLWGPAGGVWLSEGVATASTGGCREWSIDEVAAALYEEKELATTTVLRRRFRTGGNQGIVHYISAASLVLYIDDTFGREKVKELWKSGLGGIEGVLGISALELERRWRNHIAQIDPPARWSTMVREINRQGC